MADPILPITYRANGKLLLTGEYFVLSGGAGLALPVTKGQSLIIEKLSTSGMWIIWKSVDNLGKTWFEGTFSRPSGKYISGTDEAVGRRLEEILGVAKQMNENFLEVETDIFVKTMLDFPRNWGLGTSSTLLYNIARWANVNPFQLLFQTMGGSGYDIAAAGVSQPILYRLLQGKPVIRYVPFDPRFKSRLYFVFLGQKQNSREGIATYRKKIQSPETIIKQLDDLTGKIIDTQKLTEFEKLITGHERIISDALGLPTAKEKYFPDYHGAVKSLGAWGGDFVLATSRLTNRDTKRYFFDKGFEVVLEWENMVLS